MSVFVQRRFRFAFAALPDAIHYSLDFGPLVKHVAVELCKLASTFEVWASNETIADRAKVCLRSVKIALASLRKTGFIRNAARPRKGSRRTLILTWLCPADVLPDAPPVVALPAAPEGHSMPPQGAPNDPLEEPPIPIRFEQEENQEDGCAAAAVPVVDSAPLPDPLLPPTEPEPEPEPRTSSPLTEDQKAQVKAGIKVVVGRDLMFRGKVFNAIKAHGLNRVLFVLGAMAAAKDRDGEVRSPCGLFHRVMTDLLATGIEPADPAAEEAAAKEAERLAEEKSLAFYTQGSARPW